MRNKLSIIKMVNPLRTHVPRSRQTTACLSLGAIGLLCSLLGPAALQAEPRYLSEHELMSRLTGNTLRIYRGDRIWTQYHNPDGRVAAIVDNDGILKSAYWVVRDQMFCTISRRNKRNTDCYSIYRNNDQFFLTEPNGSVSKVEFIPGDPLDFVTDIHNVSRRMRFPPLR